MCAWRAAREGWWWSVRRELGGESGSGSFACSWVRYLICEGGWRVLLVAVGRGVAWVCSLMGHGVFPVLAGAITC